jgi:macrolide transport system ATP-binding/permease protein
MRWLFLIQMRLRSLFGRPRLENELADELRFHLEEHIHENVAAGMQADQARLTALAEIGASTR